MEWKDIVFLLGIGFAALAILYRAIKKRKMCPVKYGPVDKGTPGSSKGAYGTR